METFRRNEQYHNKCNIVVKKILVILVDYIIGNVNLAATRLAQLIVSTLPFITCFVEQFFNTLRRVKSSKRGQDQLQKKAQKILKRFIHR